VSPSNLRKGRAWAYSILRSGKNTTFVILVSQLPISLSRFLLVLQHGGGVRCKLEGCNRVAIGKLQLCRAHGGGIRPRSKKSNRSSPSESVEFQDFADMASV
jgi:hypothetical protein